IALRYFNASGSDPDGEIGECHEPETHVIPLVLGAAAGRRDAFTVFGSDYPTPDGTCIRDYIHVSDLADAHGPALPAVLQGGETGASNVVMGRVRSASELVQPAQKIPHLNLPIVFAPRRPADPPALVSDPRRARERLEWSPRYPDIAEHISHAWAWRQSGGGGGAPHRIFYKYLAIGRAHNPHKNTPACAGAQTPHTPPP